MSFERMVVDLDKAEKASQKFEGRLTKTANAIERFMQSEKGIANFAKRIIYSIRGGFNVINKTFLAFRVSGKIYDKTVGGLINSNSLLGKSFKLLSKIKVPDFSGKLGEGIRGVSRFAKKLSENPMPISQRLAPLTQKQTGVNLMKAARRRRKDVIRQKGQTKLGGEGGFAALFEDMGPKGFEKIAKKIDTGKFQTSIFKKLKAFDWLGKSKGLIIGVFKLSRTILSKAFNFLIVSLLVVVAVVAFIKVFWTTVQSLYTGFMKPFEGFYEGIQTALHTIWDSFSTILDFFMGDASLLDVAFALLDLMVASAYIILKFAFTVLKAVLSALWQVLLDAGAAVLDYFKSLTWGKWIGVITVVLVGILAYMFSFPIIVPALITAGVLIVAKWLWDRLSDWDVFHAGGTSHGGMAIVGERGPEIVNLPAGSKVSSNRKSRTMVGNGGVTNINITINARDTSDGEMRRIANKIGNMVNNKINRTTSSRTMG